MSAERTTSGTPAGSKPTRGTARGLAGDAAAGLVAGLYSIPEGIGYAQLAGLPPMLGVYGGMAPVAASALTTGSVLMVSTFTSAIALTTNGVLDSAELTGDVRAVFTLTLLAGVIMAALGALKLGKLVNYVSNSVMTGFVMGVAVLIAIGKAGDIFGYHPTGTSNKVVQAVEIVTHPGEWQPTTLAVGAGTIAGVLALKAWRPTRRIALVLGVALGTAVVWVFGIDTPLIADVASIPSGLDALPFPRNNSDLPDLSLIPDLVAGAASIALVALAQGAGIRPTFPNPTGPEASSSRDFLGQGIGNLVGSLFQSPATGGSLSRTAVSVQGGATSRRAGVFAALWLLVLVVVFAPVVGQIPEAVVAGLLFVIGLEIVLGRMPDARLAWRTGRRPACFLLAALVLSLAVPLQWAIVGGAVLSLLDFVASSGNRARFHHCRRDSTGWVVSFDDPPSTIPVGAVLVLAYEGPNFFAEVPALIDSTPNPDPNKGPGVVVLNIGLLTTFSSTFLKALARYHDQLDTAGCRLVVCGVNDQGLDTLQATGLLDRLGPENVLALRHHLGENLDAGEARAETLLAQLKER